MDDLLRKKLERGERTLGIMLSEIYVPNITRILARCGFDFLLIDCEHGYFDMTHVADLIAVSESVHLPVIIRVTQASRTNITKYLDMGAQGILLSDVADEEEAKKLVSLCRYAPEGDRGISTFRAHTNYSNGNTWEIMRKANESVVVICQIESGRAVEHIDAITAVPGVDGVLIGPNDLSQHLGIFGQFDHPMMREAFARVAAGAKKNGKWSGIITTKMPVVRECADLGMTCFSAGSELSSFYNGAKAQYDQLCRTLEREETVWSAQ